MYDYDLENKEFDRDPENDKTVKTNLKVYGSDKPPIYPME